MTDKEYAKRLEVFKREAEVNNTKENLITHLYIPTEDSYDQLKIPPETVVPVDRFRSGIDFLRKVFSHKKPKEVVVQSRRVFQLLYGFADASGTGFGSSMISRAGVRLRVGVWGIDDDMKKVLIRRSFKTW